MGDVDRLVGFTSRAGGTDAERRAARYLAARLEELGRDAHIEPIRVWPAFAPALLLIAIAGVTGSVLTVSAHLAGFLVVLLAAITAFGELSGSFFLARLPFGSRASQNVSSHENTDKPGRILLVAAYDAPRDAALFREQLRRWPTVFFWSLMVILACATVRLVGIGPSWLTVIQFIPTVVLIAAIPLFAEAAIADVSAGANWNASGVATVLDLAARHGGRLEHFDLSVLLVGAGHPLPLGMRAWLRRHRDDLDAETTAVVCIESAGYGTPHYATKEGLVFPARLHPALNAIAADIEGARPFIARSATAAYAARGARLPAIRISGLGVREYAPDTVDEEALARTLDFTSELLERIDEQIGDQLTG